MKMETVLSNITRSWHNFVASFVLHMLCDNRGTKESLTPGEKRGGGERNKTPALTKPGHCVLCGRIKMYMFSPIHPTVQNMTYATSVVVFRDHEAETGRAEVF